jgi:hypothetical protein
VHIFVRLAIGEGVLVGWRVTEQLFECDTNALIDLLAILEVLDFPISFAEIVFDSTS